MWNGRRCINIYKILQKQCVLFLSRHWTIRLYFFLRLSAISRKMYILQMQNILWDWNISCHILVNKLIFRFFLDFYSNLWPLLSTNFHFQFVYSERLESRIFWLRCFWHFVNVTVQMLLIFHECFQQEIYCFNQK